MPWGTTRMSPSTVYLNKKIHGQIEAWRNQPNRGRARRGSGCRRSLGCRAFVERPSSDRRTPVGQ